MSGPSINPSPSDDDELSEFLQQVPMDRQPGEGFDHAAFANRIWGTLVQAARPTTNTPRTAVQETVGAWLTGWNDGDGRYSRTELLDRIERVTDQICGLSEEEYGQVVGAAK